MFSKDPHGPKNAQNGAGKLSPSTSTPTKKQAKGSRKVTQARANAQRAKLDAQADARQRTAEDTARARPSPAKRERGQRRLNARSPTTCSITPVATTAPKRSNGITPP
jgi:hypothetical protein